MTYQDGISFEHYQLARHTDRTPWELGRGLIDITFKAQDTLLDRPVALRVLREEYLADSELRERFLEEACRAARLRHSNIVPVSCFGESGERCFCAMEYPGDENLDTLVKRLGALDAATALKIADQVARAFREISRQGFALLRLDPSDVFVTYEGDEMLVRLASLRLCAANASPAPKAVFNDFSSPEQRFQNVVDIRSGIYSLGGILCGLLGGRGIPGQPPGPDSLQGLPHKVLVLLERMMENDPAKRIQSPDELRRAIANCFETEDTPHAFPLLQGGLTATDTLAEHFSLVKPLEGGNGVFYEAEDVGRGGNVVVHLFSPNASRAETAFTMDMARNLLANPHRSIVQVVEVSPDSRRAFVAYESVRGINLLDLLRRRRRFPPAEILPLLEQMGAAADHALTHRLDGLDFGLKAIRVASPEAPEEWIGSPLGLWPSLLLKIPVYGSCPAETGFHPGMSKPLADATQLPPQQSPEDLGMRYIRGIGEIVHELLGGVRPRSGSFSERTYVPLSSLSESGNLALRKALFATLARGGFSTAADFVSALRNTLEPGVGSRVVPKAAPRVASPAQQAGSPLRRGIFAATVVIILTGGFLLFCAPNGQEMISSAWKTITATFAHMASPKGG